jgi:hypothetical protein
MVGRRSGEKDCAERANLSACGRIYERIWNPGDTGAEAEEPLVADVAQSGVLRSLLHSNAQLPRHRLEYGEACGQRDPIGFIAQEKRDGRTKESGLIERTRVDAMLTVPADNSAEYEPSAGCAMVADGVPAT